MEVEEEAAQRDEVWRIESKGLEGHEEGNRENRQVNEYGEGREKKEREKKNELSRVGKRVYNST